MRGGMFFSPGVSVKEVQQGRERGDMLYTYVLGLLFFHLGPAALMSSPLEEEVQEEVCGKKTASEKERCGLRFRKVH